MLPVSGSSSVHHPNSSSTSTDQSTNSISSTRRPSPLRIEELRREIEKNIDDINSKIALWQVLATSSTNEGNAVFFWETLYGVTRELKRHEEEIQSRSQRLTEIKEEIEGKRHISPERIVGFESEIEEMLHKSQERIASLEAEKSLHTEKINTLKSNSSLFKWKFFENNFELRAFMLECPPSRLFNTRNARIFTSRYELLSPHYLTFDECDTALRGVKGFLDAGAYTPDSQPSLNRAREIQEELLEKWFELFSASSLQINFKKCESVKKYFLKDLEGPRPRRGQQSADETLGIALRGLAEGPTQEFGRILKEMGLNLLFPNNSTKIYLNPLVYQALIKYFLSLPQEAIRPIVKKLGSDYLDSLPMELRSIVLEKIQLFSQEEEFSNLFIEIIKKLSFLEKMSLLKGNSRLPHNVILVILNNSLENIKNKSRGKYVEEIKLLSHFHDYFKVIAENELEVILNDIVELLDKIHQLDLLSRYPRDYGSNTIHLNSQYRILEILDIFLKKVPREAITPVLMGITEVWELFSETKKYELMGLLKEYLPSAINKNKILASMIKNWEPLFKKDRPKIIELLTPYLNGSDDQEVPLSILKELAGKWQDLSVGEQKKVLDWMGSYLSQDSYRDRYPELLEAIRENFEKLSKTAQPKASTLLKRASA